MTTERYLVDRLAYRLGPSAPREVVLLLHGVGASALQLLPIADALTTPIRACLLLDGPEPFDQGEEGRQWFSLSGDRHGMEAERLATAISPLVSRITKLVTYEGVSPPAVSLVGFSQGATLALALAAEGFAMGNCVALAGRSPRSVHPVAAQSPRMLISHGEEDAVVPFAEGLRAAKHFREAGFTIEFLAIKNGGHLIGKEQIQATRKFLAG